MLLSGKFQYENDFIAGSNGNKTRKIHLTHIKRMIIFVESQHFTVCGFGHFCLLKLNKSSPLVSYYIRLLVYTAQSECIKYI